MTSLTAFLGPSSQRTTPQNLAWARAATCLKAMDDLTPLQQASPAAELLLWRAFLVEVDPRAPEFVADAIIAQLRGFSDPRLVVEGVFELFGGGAKISDHVDFLQRFVARLHWHHVKAAIPTWGSGAYGADDWDVARRYRWFGADYVALQAYWGLPPDLANPGAVLTPWNALRYRAFWDPAIDPDILIVECGRDRVRDGVGGTYVGGGWRATGIGVTAGAYVNELVAFAQEVAKDAARARSGRGVRIFPYVCGPTADWQDYAIDEIAPGLQVSLALGDRYPAPPSPIPLPKKDVMDGRYPLAIWKGSPNFWAGRTGLVRAIVDHIAAGKESGVDAEFAPRSTAVSAHFEVNDGWPLLSPAADVHQYVSLGDRAWANGIVEAGNTMPASFPPGENPNDFTFSNEHAGNPGRVWTEELYQADLALHLWEVQQARAWNAPFGESFPLRGVSWEDTIIGHYRISPQTREYCPGPSYPFARLIADLKAYFSAQESDVPLTPAQNKDLTNDLDVQWGAGDTLIRLGQMESKPELVSLGNQVHNTVSDLKKTLQEFGYREVR